VASYSVEIKSSVAKAIEKIDSRKTRERIVGRIHALAANPRPPGAKKLSGLNDRYRLREGDFRILYEIQDAILLVVVVKVADRKDVYRR
jgi:mRNA interferase RelE/StbE